MQLEDFRRRPRANARDSHRAARGVVVFEGLKFHALHIDGGENLAGGGIDLLEIRRADETLEHRNVRGMRRIQGKAFREDREQPGVVVSGMLEHRGVRLQEDVYGRDFTWLASGVRSLDLGAQGSHRQEARECYFHQGFHCSVLSF